MFIFIPETDHVDELSYIIDFNLSMSMNASQFLFYILFFTGLIVQTFQYDISVLLMQISVAQLVITSIIAVALYIINKKSRKKVIE